MTENEKNKNVLKNIASVKRPYEPPEIVEETAFAKLFVPPCNSTGSCGVPSGGSAG